MNRATALTVVLAVWTAGSATAEEVEDLAQKFGHITHSCLAAQPDIADQKACIGRQAETCMEQTDGGHSTLGMVFCTAGETEIWDDLLNAEWPLIKAWAADLDSSDKEYFPEFARRAETLLAAQRAWIAFRDAQCDLEYARWGAGSMRQTAGTGCMLDMTANRVLDLRTLRMEY